MKDTKLTREFLKYNMNREVAENTISGIKNTIRLLEKFVPVTYKSIRALDVNKARHIINELEKDMVNSSVKTFKGYISSLYNFLAMPNPFFYAKLKKQKRAGDESEMILQPNELGQIFSNFNNLKLVDKVIVEIYFNTGIRNKELVNCDIEDYNSDEKVLKLNNTKTSQLEYIELSEKTCKLIDEYLTTRHDCDKALIVSSKFNKRLGVKSTLKVVKNFCSDIEKNVTLQMVRRTLSSILLANDVPENDTEDRLRHRKVGSVGRTNYQKKVNDRMYQLAEKWDNIIELEVIKYQNLTN